MKVANTVPLVSNISTPLLPCFKPVALAFKSSSSSSSSPSVRSITNFSLLRLVDPNRCRRPAFSTGIPFAGSPIATMATEPVDVLVKAAIGNPGKIGDCPFSQRVLLTLEEKGIPYNVKLVDLTNKPDWFLEINPEGKVPLIKHEDKWVPDSDVITQILEEKFPEPSLQTPPEKASVGSKIFSSFVKFLKSKDSTDGSEGALVNELTALDYYLKDNGPFIHGEKVTAADLSLAPKLLHMEVALGHYKNWSLPSNLTHLRAYIDALHTRDSFSKTKPEKDHVIAGWQKAVA